MQPDWEESLVNKAKMKNKKIVHTLLVLGALYGVIFVYQRYKRRKANEAVDTYEEALKKLQEENFSTF